MRRTRIAMWSAAVAAGLGVSPAADAAVNWTGTGGASWATGSSWSNGSGPTAGDTVNFTDAGSTTFPNEVTSVLNADRTIGGLTFTNNPFKYHTLDLGTRTLTVAGNFSFNIDQGMPTTTTIRNGALVINSPFATVGVGRGVSASSHALVDLTGLSAFTSNTQSFLVGTSTANTARGTLTLGPSSDITANLIQVGASHGSEGTLHLGLANTIRAAQWDIGKDDSHGDVDVVSGAAVSIGTATQRTILNIANQNTGTNATYTGTLDLGNAASVNLRLDSLIVAQKTGGPGGTTGQLFGGADGNVVIGNAAARGNIAIANTINGGTTTGTVDFSRMGSLQAFVNDVKVGTAASGNATGTFLLPTNSTIDASNNITVGSSGGGTNRMTVGAGTTTLLANRISVGEDYSNGLLLAPAGATLNLGSPARRVSLFLGNSNANTNAAYNGSLDVTGATLNASLSGLIVGQRQGGGGGTSSGTITGATGGTVDVGAPGTNTANVVIGNALTGGGPASGSVNFGGLASFTANLNTLSLGTSPSGGSARGTLVLAQSNNINANSIVVGSGGGETSSITLGQNNAILTNQLTIAEDAAHGSVTLPANGVLNLGSPAQRTNVTIATSTAITPNLYIGAFDASAGTLVGYLDQVVVGDKSPASGGEQGTFSIGNRNGNHVEANSIALGGATSTGTLNFAGGRLIAGAISGGAGTANFNWSGGTLSVGTFGTSTRLFNLNNASAGTLAPGSTANPIGTTQVYGNYTQSSAATTALQIGGVSPGSGNDLLSVSGSATLAGSLSLSFTNGYTPAVGQNILLANYGSRTGTYGFVAPPTMPQDVAFALDYATSPTQLTMRMVAPGAQNWTSAAAQGNWSTAGNWSGATVPTTATAASIVNNTGGPQTVTVASPTTAHRVTLQGASPASPLNFEVQQGVKLGVANQLVVGPDAALTGGGQVLGNLALLAGGSISPGGPGVATLAVDGDLDAAAGQVSIGVGGSPAGGAFDKLSVSGDANLGGGGGGGGGGGAIALANVNGYAPVKTHAYPVLTYGSHSGRFAPLAQTPSAPGESYSLHYGDDQVTALAGEWDSAADVGGEFDVPGGLLLSGDWHWSGLLVKRGAGTLTVNLNEGATTGAGASLAIVDGTFALGAGGDALVLDGLAFGDLGQLTGDPDLNGVLGIYYASVSAVPEPASLAALSLCLLARVHRPRRRA